MQFCLEETNFFTIFSSGWLTKIDSNIKFSEQNKKSFIKGLTKEKIVTRQDKIYIWWQITGAAYKEAVQTHSRITTT